MDNWCWSRRVRYQRAGSYCLPVRICGDYYNWAISCSFGVRDVVFCIRIPALIKCYVQILKRTVLICVLDYGPLDSVLHLIVFIMLWSSFEVGSCLGGSACSVWILVFLFFGWFCCTCFLFLLVSLLVVAWLAVCVSLCMCLCVCVYVGVFT